MLRLVRGFWRTVLVVSALVGILYLPVDIQGLPSALQPTLDAIMTIDRETYLIALAVIFGSWIVWTDIRPYVYHLLSKSKVDPLLEKRRQLIFEKTGELRVSLANRIGQLMFNGPDAFSSVADISKAFNNIHADSETFLGLGHLGAYIIDFERGMHFYWLAQKVDPERDNPFEALAWPYQQQCQHASNAARYWLLGEKPDVKKYYEERRWANEHNRSSLTDYFERELVVWDTYSTIPKGLVKGAAALFRKQKLKLKKQGINTKSVTQDAYLKGRSAVSIWENRG